MKFKITTRTLITVFILLFLLLSSSAVIDYLSRRKAVIENMTHFSRLLANTIQKSTANSIISYNLLDHYIETWYIGKLEYLIELEKYQRIDNEFLQDYAAQTKSYFIVLYNQRGEREFSSHSDRKLNQLDSLIYPILQGKESKLVFGILPQEEDGNKLYAIALARSKGGVIVGAIHARRFSAIQGIIGIEKYLNTITADTSIIYIAIQDSNGINARTENLNSLSLFSSDKLLTEVNMNNQFRWRIINYHNERIFEAILPLEVINKPYGIIRIGLSYSPVQKMQREVLNQILIRLSVLLIISFILFSYSISIQNIQLLEDEKEKITSEVYTLQHDLRHKEKMSAIGELAAGIAHEIRNPLGAISMTVQRLEREFKIVDGDDELKRLFSIIKKEVDHISASIKNLLQFSKPAPLQKSWNQLDKIIEKIIDLYRTKATEAGISLIWSNHEETETYIDPVKMNECLINILENAIAATPAGGKIELGLKQKNREVIITIKDTGHGILAENLSKIFNLYFTTKVNGTGLGLAHAQQIVAEHGGKIRVDSRENQGTTFTIILPANHAN